MRRRIKLMMRKELSAAINQRYRAADRKTKKLILDEFTKVTGYRRKTRDSGFDRQAGDLARNTGNTSDLTGSGAGSIDCALGGCGPYLRKAAEGAAPAAG